MAYDIHEYYDSIQMNLPVLYYEGRNNPPHPEVWINYFLKIFGLYSSKVLSIALNKNQEIENKRLSHLTKKTKIFLEYLRKHKISQFHKIGQFTPIELASKLKVTNRTIINWSSELVKNGYLTPILINKRIRQYKVN